MQNIILLNTSDLIPYAFNNRKHSDTQIDRIANSIKEFGFNAPIVVDESNVILVGHGRLAAAQKLGLEQVPVIRVTDLSETQKKAYRILDNKLQNDSEWDFGNLGLELANLEESGLDLKAWGLESLLDLAPPETEPEASEDAGPGKLPDEPFVKRGDILELGPHRVMCGDCTEELPLAKKIDLVLTDPPYGVSYVGKTKEALTIENDSLDASELATMWVGCLDNLWQALKPGGVIYATVPAGPLRQVFANALLERKALRQELVWLKNVLVMGRSDYHYIHEPILYGWKPGAAHYITPDRTKTDVLVHDRPMRNQEHPTMKPISLWAELISNSSRKGDVVYDPFLGSGTTLIAADQLGRVCYGMEISPAYCQVILERYQCYCADNNKHCTIKINGEDFISRGYKNGEARTEASAV